MTAKYYQQKYPKVWNRVYKNMMACDRNENAAHNAAFLACEELHYMKQALMREFGKIVGNKGR